jgi:hypothetical protein
MKRAAAILALCGSQAAWAHGGLPVSESILRQAGSDTMFVPVIFWGVWVGQEGQPWRWICEEEINTFRQRKMALSSDGTFYATDSKGLTVSTDNGCTWNPFQGELTTRRVTDVQVHPTDGATAFCTTADTGGSNPDGGVIPGDNALYVTHDHGSTFTRVPGLMSESARLFQGVRVSPSDPNTIYVTSLQAGTTSAPAIHRSLDGGTTFTTLPVSYQLGGVIPGGFDPMGVDPRSPQVVYFRASTEIYNQDAGASIARQALLRSTDGGATLQEVLVIDGVVTPAGQSYGIDGLAIDAAAGRVYLATAHGVYAGDDPGPGPTLTLAPTGNLSQAQCVDVHGGALYACSNNYAPDNAALAKSVDGAQSFTSILRYYDTQGPVDCPAGTPVGDNCPYYWLTYGSQLGIELNDAGMSVLDGGQMPGTSHGCDMGGGGSAVGVALVLLLAVLAISSSRTRARRG